MTSTMHPRARSAIAIVIAALTIGAPMKSSAETESISNLCSLMERLLAAAPMSKVAIEEIVGSNLDLVSTTGSYNFYSSHASVFEAAGVEEVDYREPAGGYVLSGSLLAFTLGDDACVTRETILARYSPLKIVEEPRGRSLQEQVVYSRREVWGSLSFGFTESSPDCLKTIIFTVDAPGAQH